MAKHFTRKKSNKEGVFEKSSNYRKVCEGCGDGYHKALWQAHHILPGTALSKGRIKIEVGDAKKADYIENCKWITKWNLNETPNLMGLPTIWDYILGDWKSKAAASQKEAVVPLNAKKKKLIKKLLALFSGSGPVNLPVHNPVSWGHAVFNDEVATYLVDEIWNHLDEKKAAHKINPESILAQLKKASNYFRKQLHKRGERPDGTKKNWKKRTDPTNTTWFKSFSMEQYPMTSPI
jgi:hypothetical protein